tara:strand:+ start:22282 stop:23409 length:1128 start_codon:yes stop_codon:yes gene_type:complete
MRFFKHSIKILFLGILFIFISCKEKYPNLKDGIYAEFVTTKGTMVAKLFYKTAPHTVANFVSLAEGTNTLVDSVYKDQKFYNNTIFYRVIDSFMIQGGDPTGTGFGNPGYRFDDEFNPNLKHNRPGVLGMANDGPNTNGSQFYITEIPKPNLDNTHSVFGQIVLGLDVLDSITNIKTTIEGKPIKDIVLKELNIIRKGIHAKTFNAPKVFIDHFAKLERLKKIKEAKEQALLKKAREKFNAQNDKSVLLPSGLQYVVTKKGTGKKLTETSKARVDYAVYFDNGKLIETSKLEIAEAQNAVNEKRKATNKYKPIVADLSPDARMIAGFKEGLQQLNVGDKATLFIPYHLAYGSSGNNAIPPKSDLIFEVEILEVVK